MELIKKTKEPFSTLVQRAFRTNKASLILGRDVERGDRVESLTEEQLKLCTAYSNSANVMWPVIGSDICIYFEFDDKSYVQLRLLKEATWEQETEESV